MSSTISTNYGHSTSGSRRMTTVMIDTSAWIHFLRDDERRVADAVEELIAEDRAAVTGPVVAELLR
ncbi:MAG: PIN domain-containing protein, partial [Bradymonadaceae bacterium]